MDNQTIEKYNTMQFRPDNVDRDYIHDYTMIKLSSNYFSSATRKFHNSKIMRVLFCDPFIISPFLQEDVGSAGYQVVRFTDYQQARKKLDRLEEELKTSLDCLDSFK